MHDAQTDTRRESTRPSARKWRRWYLLSVLLLLAVLLVGGVWYAVNPARQLSSAEYAEMRRFMDTPSGFPANWVDAASGSAELDAAVREFGRVYEAVLVSASDHNADDLVGLRYYLASPPLAASQWQEIQAFAIDTAPLVAALERMIAVSDYSYPRATTRMGIGDPSVGVFMHFLIAGRMVYLRAVWQGHQKETDAALETCLAALRMYRTEPPVSWLHYNLASGGAVAPLSLMASLAVGCGDPAILQRLLREMEPLTPAAALPDGATFLRDTIVWDLAVAQQVGVHVRLDPAMTGRQLVRGWNDWRFYLEPTSSPLPPGKTMARRWSHLRELGMYGFWRNFKTRPARLYALQSVAEFLGLEGLSEQYAYLAGAGGILRETLKTEATLPAARALFDLSRLAIASHLLELETGAKPASMSDLSPRYFAEPLPDPFNGKPYLFSATREAFYSVGPDGDDDRGEKAVPSEELFSPSPGRAADGDVLLETETLRRLLSQ